jgi:hypothetical protein
MDAPEENSGDEVKNNGRNDDGTFAPGNPYAIKPGISGNPGGRPKKERTFKDTAKEILKSNILKIEYRVGNETKIVDLQAEKDFYHGLVASMIAQALSGKVPALRELIDRTEGKPVETIKMQTEGSVEHYFTWRGKPISELTIPEQIESLDEKIGDLVKLRDELRTEVCGGGDTGRGVSEGQGEAGLLLLP